MKLILLTITMLLIGCITETEINTEKEDITGEWCSDYLINKCVNVTYYQIEYTRQNGSFAGILNIEGEVRYYWFSYYNSLISIEFEEITLILERKEFFLH